MSLRFHKSFTLIPGLRLNLSKNGLSASIGGAPFTLNVGSNGFTETASIPGTGLSYRHHTPFNTDPEQYHNDNRNAQVVSSTSSNPMQEIRSASTELLTSKSLVEIKRLIQMASDQCEGIVLDLSEAMDKKIDAELKFSRWDNGYLLKRIFKKAFQRRREDLDREAKEVSELEDQVRLSKIDTHIELEPEQETLYYEMLDKFSKLCECASIWDIKSTQAVNQFHDRTIANRRLSREKIKFSMGRCDIIQWEKDVPHLGNANGGDLFLYPGFILYRVTRGSFSLIEYQDITGLVELNQFLEDGGVPSDSKIVGQTWAKSNKDGSRDKRFIDNYQIPIVLYGNLTLKSSEGLFEAFMFSNPQLVIDTVDSLNKFTASFQRITG